MCFVLSCGFTQMYERYKKWWPSILNMSAAIFSLWVLVPCKATHVLLKMHGVERVWAKGQKPLLFLSFSIARVLKAHHFTSKTVVISKGGVSVV